MMLKKICRTKKIKGEEKYRDEFKRTNAVAADGEMHLERMARQDEPTNRVCARIRTIRRRRFDHSLQTPTNMRCTHSETS